MLLRVLQPLLESRFPFPSFDRFGGAAFRHVKMQVKRSAGRNKDPQGSPQVLTLYVFSRVWAPWGGHFTRVFSCLGALGCSLYTCFLVSGRPEVLILHLFSAL